MTMDSIEEMYSSGLSTRAIGKITGQSKSVIARMIKLTGISRDRLAAVRGAKQINSQVAVDWSFIPLDTGKAWLLGLLFGDGSIRKDLCQVTVTSAELDVLDKINALFAHRLHVRKNGGCSVISINSQRIARELMAGFGLIPHKTSTILYPCLLYTSPSPRD